MCLPQDPISRALNKIDPLAKVDGRLHIQEKYGSKLDPVGSALSRQTESRPSPQPTTQRRAFDPLASNLRIGQ